MQLTKMWLTKIWLTKNVVDKNAVDKNVADMCNVQNNDLDLPMRVYQKASKLKKT